VRQGKARKTCAEGGREFKQWWRGMNGGGVNVFGVSVSLFLL